MNQLAKTQGGKVARADKSSDNAFRLPFVDIKELDNEYVIDADMPGVKKENIDIQFQQGELTIHGSAASTEKQKDRNYRFRQFESSDYYRSFRVSEAVDATAISADYRDGVLTVRLPKSEAVKPRKIEIAKK